MRRRGLEFQDQIHQIPPVRAVMNWANWRGLCWGGRGRKAELKGNGMGLGSPTSLTGKKRGQGKTSNTGSFTFGS